MPGGGSKPGERRGGRQRGTPNKTLTEQAQALGAKVAKAEARANAKLVALAHAIQATVAESRGLPGASARFKELVLNALVAEKLALTRLRTNPRTRALQSPRQSPQRASAYVGGSLREAFAEARAYREVVKRGSATEAGVERIEYAVKRPRRRRRPP